MNDNIYISPLIRNTTNCIAKDLHHHRHHHHHHHHLRHHRRRHHRRRRLGVKAQCGAGELCWMRSKIVCELQ